MITNFDVPVNQVDDRLMHISSFIEEITPLLRAYNAAPSDEAMDAVSQCLHRYRGYEGFRPNGFIIKTHGACWLSSRLHGLTVDVPFPMMDAFPHYSGDRQYPVKPTDDRTAENAYNTVPDLWAGEYGLRRIEYLQLFKEAALSHIGGKHPKPYVNISA